MPTGSVPAGTSIGGRLRRCLPLEAVDRLGSQAWSLVGIAALLGVVGLVLARVGWFLVPLVFSVVVGVIASPIVKMLERRGLGRGVATGAVFVLIVAVTVAVLYAIIPPFVTQATRLVSSVPDFFEDVAADTARFEERLSSTNPAAVEALRGFQDGLEKQAVEFADRLPDTMFGIVNMSFAVVIAAFVGAILAYLAVKDLPVYTDVVNRWLERPDNLRVSGALRQMARTGTLFIRGQLLLAMIVGLASGLALALIGVPFPVPLGVLAGIGELIPTVGPILAGIPAVIFALGKGGIGLGLLAAGVLFLVQQAESYLLVPLVVGKVTEMSAITVIVALTVAGGTFGIIGMIVVIPLLAMVRDGLRWFFMSDGEVLAAMSVDPV